MEEKRRKEEEQKIKNLKEGKLKILCAYALDNECIYPTLVPMTSLAENEEQKTFYEIYILINQEFKLENINILKSVQSKYPEQCEVIFITNKYIPTAAYYKLDLNNKLSNANILKFII